jgi:hypothetical protein
LLRIEPPSVSNARVSLASIASWADDYRAEHIEITNWHFVNIPNERDAYDPALDCKTDPKLGYCIINAINRFQKALADCAKPATERSMALKFLVHFVGDV